MITKLLAKYIINKHAEYMGDYFDYIQGNEEEIDMQAYEIIKNANIFQKIKILIKGVD